LVTEIQRFEVGYLLSAMAALAVGVRTA